MPNSNPDQLTLGVGLDDDAQFKNFFVSDANQSLVSALAAGAEEPFLYIWGNGSPGLSHLLQASCNKTSAEGQAAIYVPLADQSQFAPQILEGAESLSLVCIDDIESIAGDVEWEAALFTAFNAMRQTGTQLIIAGHMAAQQLTIQLPDLHSRLQSGLLFQLFELSDEDKLSALQLRARQRGFDLPDAVGEFILLRAQRSLSALMQILDELDHSSMQQQRKLTVPLVKSTLGW
ncbi:MAG: DnaA regulatory inactivator Hda [Proteobacteria bacterium]|jgi:DnaA-homolog protein|nr:DnaA regulatory inactivator Hda [Pseudomonadota bacterium]MDA1291543.1 DnaA regulatory inactivator Hda [Pseudomonadota bacterium]